MERVGHIRDLAGGTDANHVAKTNDDEVTALGVMERLSLGQPSGRHHLRDQALDADVVQRKPVDVDGVLAERACLDRRAASERGFSLNPHSLGGASLAAMSRSQDERARRGIEVAPITRRASAASSARASMAGGVTCSGKALVSQCAPEAPLGVTFRQKVLRYQRTAQSVLNRGGKALSRRRDPAQCLIQRSTASGVRPSLECFRRTDASAPPAESLPAPKIFLQKRLSHKGYPLYGTEPFLDRFLSEGA